MIGTAAAYGFAVLFIVILAVLLKRKGCPAAPPWTTGPTHSGPRHVVIIRHGEKDKAAGSFLDPDGVIRANNLVQWAIEFPKTAGIAPFSAVIAPVPHTGTAVRPEQTVLALCFKNNIPLYGTCASGQFDCVLNSLKRIPNVENGSVLLSWEHSCIPSLAAYLMNKPVGGDWGKDDYSSVVVIDMLTKTATLSCEQINGGGAWNASNASQCATAKMLKPLAAGEPPQKCSGKKWLSTCSACQ